MKRHRLRRFFGLSLSIGILLLSSCPAPPEISLEMSSREVIEQETKGNRKAVISVGIVQNGQMSFTVYGENGRVLPDTEHVYEIASITKTFTAQLFARAINEGRVNLDDKIDRFLDLPSKKYYPTIKRIFTHTSGYKSTYYHNSGSSIESTPNFEVFGVGVTKRMLLNTIGAINLNDKDYPCDYSNFALAVAGLVLENIYNDDYTSMMNRYLSNDLGLQNTRVNDGKSVNVSNFWAWSEGNPYIPAGALVSTITDMMKYAQMQIDGQPSYVSQSHTKLAEAEPPMIFTENNFDIKTDAMGLAWMMDSAYDVIWHGGNTLYSNSFLGFDKANSIAAVVLVNMPGQQSRTIGSAVLRELRR
jgi:CubicO group peptidase (beta-lactamase class C family)